MSKLKKDWTLKKWPLRPGWSIANRLTKIGADIMAVIGAEGDTVDLRSIDFAKIAGVISDENLDLVLDMLTAGLLFKGGTATKEMVEALSLEEAVELLEEVLKHNLSFLASRLASLKPSNGTSTPPPQS